MADNTTETSLLQLVLENHPEHYEVEDVYEFSNGRKFKNTDGSDSGVYDN